MFLDYMADHLESIVLEVLEPSKDLGGFECLGGPNFNGGALDPCAYPVVKLPMFSMVVTRLEEREAPKIYQKIPSRL